MTARIDQKLAIKDFLNHMGHVEKASSHTLRAYQNDLAQAFTNLDQKITQDQGL